MAEFPDKALEWWQWQELFEMAGYTTDGEPPTRPTDAVRLYRAAPVENQGGHSWTEDVEVAGSFLEVGGVPARRTGVAGRG